MNLASQLIHRLKLPLSVISMILFFGSALGQVTLTPAQLSRIGQRIWQNECSGTEAGLTSWNVGEDFASLGIGHFIWYPKGQEGPFEESFPPLVQYLAAAGASVPSWLLQTPDCPWSNRAAFVADAKSQRQVELRSLLKKTVPLQTAFIIQRLQRSVPALIRAGGKPVATSHAQLSQSAEGMFAMIDYINFKGEGLKSTERYKGQGWGLAQVLGTMRAESPAAAPAAFASAAKAVLAQRVKNSPAERKEQRWLAGWQSRCERYKEKL
jgi:hypothetical protein